MNEAGTFSPKEEMGWPVSTRKLDGIGTEDVIMGGQDLPNEHVLWSCSLRNRTGHSLAPGILCAVVRHDHSTPFSTTLSPTPHPP